MTTLSIQPTGQSVIAGQPTAGDGDAFSIGIGHLIHGMKRNLDVCYVIMDNAIYGLTKGQTSPTSDVGYKSKTTPRGNIESPMNPIMLAATAGASFVARAFSGRPTGDWPPWDAPALSPEPRTPAGLPKHRCLLARSR